MRNPPKRPKPGEAPAPSKRSKRSKRTPGTPPGVDPVEWAAADRGRALVYVNTMLAFEERVHRDGGARLRDWAPAVALQACADVARPKYPRDAEALSAAASMCSKWSITWSDLDGARVVRLSGPGGDA